MLGEENSNSKFKSFILKLIFVVLLLFILIWLFPTKGFMNQKIDESVNEKLDDSASKIFNENIEIMRDAAHGYFTGSRLPENGEKEVITLDEMLEKHLVVEFTDSKNSTCDKEESYVEVTNENGEYVMKVNLSCTDIKDYVIIYMNTNLMISSVSSGVSVNSCEYEKITNAKWSDYSAWSAWQTSKISETAYNKVETKTEEINAGAVSVKHTDKVAATEKEVKKYTCDSSYDNKGTYEKETECIKTDEPKTEMRAKKVYICDSSYYNEGIYTKYTKCVQKNPATVSKTVAYVCSSGYDNAGTYNEKVTCIKTSYTKEKQYKTVTYYRQKTRTLLSSDSDVKWSNCNDMSLINQGYTKTGNVK